MIPVNYYTVSFFGGSISALLWGFFVYLKHTKHITYRMFLGMSICCSFWSLGVGIMIVAPSKAVAANIERFFDAAVAFIVPFWFSFTMSAVGKQKEQKFALRASYLAAFLLSVCYLLFQPLMVRDFVPRYSFNYWVEPNTGYYFLMLHYLVFVNYALYVLIRSYKDLTVFKKRQIQHLVLSSILGFAGGTTAFLTTLNIMPPYLIIMFSLYPIILAYGVIRYRLFDIETVMHKTFLWGTTVVFLLLPPAYVFLVIVEKIKFLNIPFIGHLLVSALLLLLFYYYYFYLRPKIDHVFRRRRYDYSQILSMLSLSLKGELDINRIAGEVASTLKGELYLQKIGIFIRDIKSEKLMPLIEEGCGEEIPSLSAGDSFIEYLKEHNHLETELVDVDPALSVLKDSVLYRCLKKEEVPLVLTLTLEGDFIGLIFLGKRENLEHYTIRDIEILGNISSDVSLYFYNALHHEDVLEKQRLQQEISLAKNIQENLLPLSPPEIPGISLYGLYVPSKEIGGDYYDFIVQDEKSEDERSRRLYITIGDVSGKGLDAGLVVSSVKTSLVFLGMYNTSCREILNILNEKLYLYLNQQKFLSLLLMRYLPEQGAFSYSSAGHEHILICRAGKDGGASGVEVRKSGGVILGMIDHVEEFLEEDTLTLDKGDKVLIYTDGATEARNPQESFFGLEGLIESFQRHAHLPIKETIHSIYGDIKEFISTRDQYDDITLVGIEKE